MHINERAMNIIRLTEEMQRGFIFAQFQQQKSRILSLNVFLTDTVR